MKQYRYTSRLLAAALTLSLGLASSAFSMPRDEHGGPGFPMHGAPMHFAHSGKAMQRLHDELQLDAKQETAWQDAEAFAKSTFAGTQERARKQHEEINAALSQPGADLRALIKRMDDLRADGQKQRDAVRERWLSVYDTLSGGQKEKVRLFFKMNAERMGRAMEHRGPHHAPADAPRPN